MSLSERVRRPRSGPISEPPVSMAAVAKAPVKAAFHSGPPKAQAPAAQRAATPALAKAWLAPRAPPRSSATPIRSLRA